MRSLISGSMRARRGVIAAAAVILAFGVWQLRHADLDSLPEFTPTVVEVQTEALGLSAEEMEQLITVPLEQDLLNGVAWMDSIRSQSVPGLSSIVMEFEPGTDLYRARQVVQERLNEAHALPNVAKVPAMLQPQSSTSRAMMISLSSEELTPIQLGVLARWTIVPRLTGVPGVSNVVIWGQKERQLQVLVDPERLAQLRRHPRPGHQHDRQRAVGVAAHLPRGVDAGHGWVHRPEQPAARRAAPLADHDGRRAGPGGHRGLRRTRRHRRLRPGAPLRLGDVADVVEDHQALIGDAVVNGGEGLILVVEKLPDTSTTAVTAGVEDALASMEAGLDGVVVDTGIYRPATYLEDAGSNLARSVVIGAILLVVGLVAFLFSWRRALISLVAIGFSLLAATAVLYLREATFNAVVIAGLVMAVAAVVDDATSGVERIGRRLRERTEGDDASTAVPRAPPAPSAADGDAPAAASPSQLVLGAALETSRTLGFALAALVVALLPVFVLEGLAGDSFYPPLAISFVIAVVVSMLVAVTVTPALALVLAAPDGGARAGLPGGPGPAGRVPPPPDAARSHADPVAAGRGRGDPARRGVVPGAGPLGPAAAQGDRPAHRLERSAERVAARDGPHHGPGGRGAARARRCPQRRRPRRPGHPRRPRRRRQHRRDLGQPGAGRAVPLHRQRHRGRRERLPRSRPQGADVLPEPHQRGAGVRADAGPRPALRAGPRASCRRRRPRWARCSRGSMAPATCASSAS